MAGSLAVVAPRPFERRGATLACCGGGDSTGMWHQFTHSGADDCPFTVTYTESGAGGFARRHRELSSDRQQ
jgi:hypothetical protein